MLEQERKFLLKYLPEGLIPCNIKQAYLMFDGDKHLRVRIINDQQAFIAFKTILSDITKTEYEYEIPLKDAQEMFKSSNCRLEKIRYKTEFDGNQVDIDMYPSGIKVVEIEFKKELLYLPDYCGQEVTGIQEYSNIWIAKNKGK